MEENEIRPIYCHLCSGREIEQYGKKLGEADERHDRACREAGCEHPAALPLDVLMAGGPKPPVRLPGHLGGGLEHPVRRVNHPDFGPIDIDEKLAPLIRRLWELDIMTSQCCQERWPGLAEIEFFGVPEVEEFLNVAQRPYKVEVETWDEGNGGEVAVRVRLLVLFPTKDIPRLVKAFAAYQPER